MISARNRLGDVSAADAVQVPSKNRLWRMPRQLGRGAVAIRRSSDRSTDPSTP